MQQKKSIAIVSGKGGTGKSIIATSIGYLLAYCGFKTLLVDMDLFTGGLTYYALADSPRRQNIALRDVFISTCSEIPPPVLLQHKFCQSNLYLLPSVTGRRAKISELHLSTNFIDMASFTGKMKDIISYYEDKGFDYILIDTRGGSDLSSIGTAIAAKSIIIVTEADKPSWDMGHVLLDAIDDAELNSNLMVDRLGFIINKNVLPSEAIEVYLKKEWQCPHLATIPLDANIIRYFQEDKVPIAEEIGTEFDISIMNTVESICKTDGWSDEQLSDLSNLKSNALKLNKSNEIRHKRDINIEAFSKWNRIYSILTIVIFFVVVKYNFDYFRNDIGIAVQLISLFMFMTLLPDILFFVRKRFTSDNYKKKHLNKIINKSLDTKIETMVRK